MALDQPMLVVDPLELDQCQAELLDRLNALDDSHRRLIISLKDRELASMTLIRLGPNAVLDAVWDQTLHIVERPAGPRLRVAPPSEAQKAALSR